MIVLTLVVVKIFTSRKSDPGFYHEFHVAEVADPVTRAEWARLTPSGPHPAQITDRRTSLTSEDGRVNRFAVRLELADGTDLTARWRGDPIMPTQVPVVGSRARVWFLPGSDVRVVEVMDPTGEFDPAE